MSPIYVPGKVVLRKTWQPMDAHAAAYITAVETADGQALEEKVKIAIDNFVLGCKADGIWSAIKASCILAGARTLSGALVPLVGTAPTNNGPFITADYNRKTGLVGNGSTKFLNSNRNNNVEPQDNRHASVFITTADTVRNYCRYLAAGDSSQGDVVLTGGDSGSNNLVLLSACMSSATVLSIPDTTTGLFGVSRANSSSFLTRAGGSNITTTNNTSRTPRSENYSIFGRPGEVPARYVNARLAFYSIGESLNLALLDARVTDLINAFGVAIP
jgi:hypothetical protein